MHPTSSAVATVDNAQSLFHERRHTADRVFRGVFVFNTAVTLFWLVAYITQDSDFAFGPYNPSLERILGVLGFVLFFYVVWGFIWYAVKNVLLKYVAGFSKEERRQAFSSRMDVPYDVADLVSRHSERRIRITDMVGRRGRFMTLAATGFYFRRRSSGRSPVSWTACWRAPTACSLRPCGWRSSSCWFPWVRSSRRSSRPSSSRRSSR